jgi:DsbC/DsbD-like thiol-disulfide interchange protein
MFVIRVRIGGRNARIIATEPGVNEAFMSTVRFGICAGVMVAAAAVAGAQGQAVVAANNASGWIELHNARVRLVGGAHAGKPAKSYLAGVEVTLADGWKTYWRMPGDAGVPPTFDWAGSTNVATLKVLYPAPTRLPEAAAETVGYKTAVLFPVEVVPQDPAKPVALKLAMEFGVCRDICIPAEAKIALALAPDELRGKPSMAMLAAVEKVPREAASRRAGDPELVRMSASLDGPDARLVIEARFPQGSDGADLFIEAPESLYVPLPKRVDAAGGIVRFEVDLSRGGNAQDLKGKTLTLTFVSKAGASEATWSVPRGAVP